MKHAGHYTCLGSAINCHLFHYLMLHQSYYPGTTIHAHTTLEEMCTCVQWIH